jgi:hypothetical protein
LRRCQRFLVPAATVRRMLGNLKDCREELLDSGEVTQNACCAELLKGTKSSTLANTSAAWICSKKSLQTEVLQIIWPGKREEQGAELDLKCCIACKAMLFSLYYSALLRLRSSSPALAMQNVYCTSDTRDNCKLLSTWNMECLQRTSEPNSTCRRVSGIVLEGENFVDVTSVPAATANINLIEICF